MEGDPVHEETVWIVSDESKLRQILDNLISNAIKFTEDGGIEVGYEQQGNLLLFHVKDSGIGIQAEYHQTIFERFRQIETTHTRKYGGNGLGLAITKSLIELLAEKFGWNHNLARVLPSISPYPSNNRYYR